MLPAWMPTYQAYEFAEALHLAREVDREAARMIVEAAAVRWIQIDEAAALLTEMYGHYITNRRLSG